MWCVLQVWDSPAMRLRLCHSSRRQQSMIPQRQQLQFPQRLPQVPTPAAHKESSHPSPACCIHVSWLYTPILTLLHTPGTFVAALALQCDGD